MKRDTAVRHLVEMAEEASSRIGLRQTEIGWPLEELWVDGELVGLADQIEHGSVVLRFDLPVEEMSWLARHPSAEWVGQILRLGKRPFAWCCRPAGWPVWNHEHRQLVRFWSADGGTDDEVLHALRTRRLEGVDVVEPGEADLRAQLEVELVASHRHLREVLAGYWDREWRGDHGGAGGPEDHLWRAATAIADIHDFLHG